jgi:hypothetical protein
MVKTRWQQRKARSHAREGGHPRAYLKKVNNKKIP